MPYQERAAKALEMRELDWGGGAEAGAAAGGEADEQLVPAPQRVGYYDTIT